LHYQRGGAAVQQEVLLEDKLSFTIHPGLITGTSSSHWPLVVKTVREYFKETGTVQEAHLRMVLMYAHVTLFKWLSKEVLPPLGIKCLKPLQHEMEKEKVPLDFGCFYEVGDKVWSKPNKMESVYKELGWRRGRSILSDTNERPIKLCTYVVPMMYFDEEVQLPHELFGYVSATGKKAKDIVVQALADRQLLEIGFL